MRSPEARDKAIRETLFKLEQMKLGYPGYEINEENLRKLKVDLDFMLITYQWRASEWFQKHLKLYDKILASKIPHVLRTTLIQVIGPFSANEIKPHNSAETIDVSQRQDVMRRVLQQLQLYSLGDRNINQRNMERLILELQAINRSLHWAPTDWFRDNIATYNSIMTAAVDPSIKHQLEELVGLRFGESSVLYISCSFEE